MTLAIRGHGALDDDGLPAVAVVVSFASGLAFSWRGVAIPAAGVGPIGLYLVLVMGESSDGTEGFTVLAVMIWIFLTLWLMALAAVGAGLRLAILWLIRRQGAHTQ